MTKLTALKISRELEVSPQTVYAWFGGDFDSVTVAKRLDGLISESVAQMSFYARRVEAMQSLRQEIEAETAVQS